MLDQPSIRCSDRRRCARSRAEGVILTGMLDDGSAGPRAIKDCSGTAVVQDPANAAEPSMPLRALASTAVDYVVPWRALAGLLCAHAQPERTTPCLNHLSTESRIHALSLGEYGMERLLAIGRPSAFTYHDCVGGLFELGYGPSYRCPMGRAFNPLSLAYTQEIVRGPTVWAACALCRRKKRCCAECPGAPWRLWGRHQCAA
jgi:two-component system chemotaxis response regulator CheB